MLALFPARSRNKGTSVICMMDAIRRLVNLVGKLRAINVTGYFRYGRDKLPLPHSWLGLV